MRKLTALLLALCMALSLFAGCQNAQTPSEPTAPPTTTPLATDPPATDPPVPPVQELYNVHLVYTLTDEEVESFNTQLLALEQLYLNDAPIEQIDAAEDALEELSDYINDQCSIANVIYSCDTTDEAGSDRFLKSQEIGNQISNNFMLCARRIYESDAPNKDYFFTDWTDAELEKLMHYTQRVMELEQRNAEILVEYRKLDDDTRTDGIIPLYKELVLNNNEIAKIYGYDNFYEYAYAVDYDRDYALEKIDVMRTYAQTYLAPAVSNAMDAFVQSFSALDKTKQLSLSALLFNDYDKIAVKYVDSYLESLPETAKAAMNKMFQENRVVFTDDKNAQEGAYTTLVDETGFCYFGPGYQSTMTVIHELGHYYGAVEGDMLSIPLDLAETQSQGNEWMFVTFVEDMILPEVYDVFVSYRLYEVIAGLLVQLAVDEFEELVYTQSDIGSMTKEDFEALMEQAASRYGGIDFYAANITDLQYYWRMVVVESPVYYISYAVSTMAALDLYTVAQKDYAGAMEIYCKLAEEEDYEEGFLHIINSAGLLGPFTENAYKSIYEAVTVTQ